jgi:glutamyl-tRNA reductase
MTEEQLEKKAEEYADKLWKDGRYRESTAPTIQEIYIAGAHCRDEEIKQLKKELSSALLIQKVLRQTMTKLANCITKK